METKLGIELRVDKINCYGLLNLLDCALLGIEDTNIRNAIIVVKELMNRLVRDNNWNNKLMDSMFDKLEKLGPPKTQEEKELDEWLEKKLKEIAEEYKEDEE